MNKNSRSSGLGLASVLTIIFIVLKLVGVIDWSWWWVFSPILIDFVIAIIAVVILVAWYAWEDKAWKFKKQKYDN